MLRLQQSQLSVQALTRLCSVYIFLLASWADTERLALVALQGALLAIPYALLEALVGRPLAAGLVPTGWHVEAWARRTATATLLPVGAISCLAVSIALPHTSLADRLFMITPVIVQLPLEALFWATAKTRSRRRANLIPQLTAVGILLVGAAFAASELRVDVAALPAQLAVLVWALLQRGSVETGQIRPGVRQSLKVGSAYCITAAVDLSYTVTLPAVAGAVAGQAAVVALRAMDLAFGPFHVALSAGTREDIVAGRRSRFLTGTRALTVVLLLSVSVVLLGSTRIREVLAADLATMGAVTVSMYCGYKLLLMASTWLSTRHMIWAPPRRYLISAIGSRMVAFGGLVVSIVWVVHISELFAQLLVCEALVTCWFLFRMQRASPSEYSGIGRVAAPQPPTTMARL